MYFCRRCTRFTMPDLSKSLCPKCLRAETPAEITITSIEGEDFTVEEK